MDPPVSERSVRDWESPTCPRLPPDEAWELLEGALRQQADLIDDALDELEGTRGPVELPYWLGRGLYVRSMPCDGPFGEAAWQLENTAREALAAILEADGRQVRFVAATAPQDQKEAR